MQWHTLDIDRVMSETASTPEGLSDDIVAAKQLQVGKNELQEKKKRPPWWLFLHQFT
ncbi:MAG: cation-transporting P-type ATPase, partial [Flavisolibacter sp.]